MSKMKKVFAMAASISIIMTSLAVMPVKAVSEGVNILGFEDFNDEENWQGTLGKDAVVYVNNGALIIENETDKSLLSNTYTYDFEDAKSGIVVASFKMMTPTLGKDYQCHILDGYNYSVASMCIHWQKKTFENAVHNYSYSGLGTGKKAEENKWHDVDMVMDIDNWTVELYVDGVLNYNGKVGMNTTNGNSETQFTSREVCSIKFSSADTKSALNIDDLAIYHYEDEWTKPVMGKEKRVLIHDNFEAPAEFPNGEFRHELNKGGAADSYDLNDNIYNDDKVLTKGFEVVQDPTGSNNKVLKHVHETSKSGWSTAARYRLTSSLASTSGTVSPQANLAVTSGKIEISYKAYWDESTNSYVRAWGTDNNANNLIRGYNYVSGTTEQYVMGQHNAAQQSETRQPVTAKKSEWHDFRIVADLDNKKVSYYADGVLVEDKIDYDYTKAATADGYSIFGAGFAILDISVYNQAGTTYYDDIRVSVLEDVAITSKQLKTDATTSSAKITTIADFVAQENPNYEITVYNSKDEAKDMLLVMAVYNEGVFEKINFVEVEAVAAEAGTTPGKTTRITTGFTDEFRGAVEEGKTIKLFVWDGIDTIKPLSDIITVD